METGSAPTVKLPDGVFRQNTLSGTNSWAQSSTTIKPMMKQTHHGQPTNRDKYENKPMPKLPVEESPAVVRSQPRYIPPAVPLVNPILQGQKMRAVTDPIQSRSVVNGKTPSITQLRKKFSSSRTDVTKIDEKEFLSYGDIPDKAQNVLGISIQRAATPSATANRRQTPAPTPFVPKSQTKLKQPLFQTKTGPSDLSSRGSIGSNHDKADLQMADGIRHHSDTAEDAIKHAQTPLQSDEAEKPAEGPSRPKIAAYGSVGKVGVIQKGALHPSGSFQGVIEMASPAKSEHDVPHRESPSAKLPSSSRSARPSEEFLNPVTYSPSNYGGIWENDPAVGHTLPPFTPVTQTVSNPGSAYAPLANHQEQKARQPNLCDSGLDTKLGIEARQHEYSQPAQNSEGAFKPQTSYSSSHYLGISPYPPSSGNSWANQAKVDSFSSGPPTSALLPSMSIRTANSVPSPPHSQFEYQRPSPVSAGLARLDLTLHHHIEAISNGLHRLIADKHDQILDKVIGRIEDLEDVVRKGLKDVKADVRSIKYDVGKLMSAAAGQDHEELSGALKMLDQKLNAVHLQVTQLSVQGAQAVFDREAEADEDKRPKRPQSQRRTESAHGAVDRGEERYPLPSESPCSPGKRGRRGQRSNTSISQPDIRMRDATVTRKEFFADMGTSQGNDPDLRNHPAYAGMQRNGEDIWVPPNLVTGISSRSNMAYDAEPLDHSDWYHHAYGRGARP